MLASVKVAGIKKNSKPGLECDHLVGLMTLSDIRHIPREQWGQVPVSNAMIPL